MTQIELGVWEFNEGAIAFYEKLGYETAYQKNVEVTEEKVLIAPIEPITFVKKLPYTSVTTTFAAT